MKENELSQLCTECQTIIKEVGKFIVAERGKVKQNEIEEKDLNSLVSYVDKTAEIKLVSQFSKLLPESTFLTEEETVEQNTGKYRWIIDPLDGTTNFLHQLPYFAVSVALEVEGEIVMGIVLNPNNDECFYAQKNKGAFLNGRRINVSSTSTLQKSLVSTGFPYHDYRREESYFKVFNYLMKNTRGIRRFGAAALDLAYVACGRYDAFFEYGLNAWDVAAGSFIVQEAGGKVYDFKSGKDFLFGKEMVAVNNNLSNFILPIIDKSFNK